MYISFFLCLYYSYLMIHFLAGYCRDPGSGIGSIRKNYYPFYRPGMAVTYNCPLGYIAINGTNFIKCRRDGTWSERPLSCIRLYPFLSNLFHEYDLMWSQYRVGSRSSQPPWRFPIDSYSKQVVQHWVLC